MMVYMNKSDANYIATNALSLNMTSLDFYKTSQVDLSHSSIMPFAC